jgi:hypothetical protein
MMAGTHVPDGVLHAGGAESNRAPNLDVGNESGHPPAVEVTLAGLEIGAGLLLGEQGFYLYHLWFMARDSTLLDALAALEDG